MCSPDVSEIRRALDVMLDPEQVAELRAIDVVTTSHKFPHVVFGYFDSRHRDEMVTQAARVAPYALGTYILANPCNPALIARAENKIKAAGKKDLTTSDSDVVSRRWLLIDVDAVRPAGISSSEEEHEEALALARSIRKTMMDLGWPEPVTADSGNGGHCLWRVDLPRDDDGLVKRCLGALDVRFSTGRVKVDQTVFNPARIWKLYGTVAGKGDSTESRPHRLAKLLDIPAHLDVVPVELLEALAGEVPKPAQKTGVIVSDRRTGSWDVETWIASHGLADQLKGPQPWQGGRRWVFPVCPWNPDHKNGSAFILEQASGALAAGCHHNGCSDNGWHDLRDVVEPGWRDRRQTAATVQPAPDKTTETRRMKVVSWQDCKPDFSTPELVAGWIGIDDLGMIYGASGTAKTFFALDLGFHIARGLTWHGHRVTQGAVVYVAVEAPSSVLKRLWALKMRHDLMDQAVPLYVVPEALDLLHDEIDMEVLIDTVLEIGKREPVRAVFIDTLAQTAAGGDENSFETMSLLAARLGAIRKRTGSAVIAIHHAGKDETRGARGHSSMKAAVESEIEIRKEEDHRVASLTKVRDGQTGSRVGFDLVPIQAGVNSRGEPVEVAVVEPLPADEIRKAPEGRQADILEALVIASRYSVNGVVPLDTWRTTFVDSMQGKMRTERVAVETWRRGIKKLVPWWVLIEENGARLVATTTSGCVAKNANPTTLRNISATNCGMAPEASLNTRNISATSGVEGGHVPHATLATHPFRGVAMLQACCNTNSVDEKSRPKKGPPIDEEDDLVPF